MFNLLIMSIMYQDWPFSSHDIDIQFWIWIKKFNKAILDIKDWINFAKTKKQGEWYEEQDIIGGVDRGECEEDVRGSYGSLVENVQTSWGYDQVCVW